MQNDLDPKTEARVEVITNALLHLPIRGKELQFAARQIDMALMQSGHLSATVPAGDGELVERLENIIAHRIDLGSTPRAIAEQCAEAASRLSQGTGATDAQVLRLTEENEALTQNAESLLEIIDMRKARIKALEEALSKVLRSEYESEEPGLCDCIDNEGNAYQSQYLATAIAEGEALLARSALSGDTL